MCIMSEGIEQTAVLNEGKIHAAVRSDMRGCKLMSNEGRGSTTQTNERERAASRGAGEKKQFFAAARGKKDTFLR